MTILDEFKAFAIRGNMVDMAVGIIIGAAFGKIVSSFVSDIVMPPLGLLLGKMDFSSLAIPLQKATNTAPEVSIKYGLFINQVIDFTIMAIVIFFVIKAMNQLKGNQSPAPTTKACAECLMEIPLQAKKCGHCGSALT